MKVLRIDAGGLLGSAYRSPGFGLGMFYLLAKVGTGCFQLLDIPVHRTVLVNVTDCCICGLLGLP